ncbi:MAG: heme-copper oxidase subunit III [Thermoleophilaceae bacterium]|jgi:cytochrome c oxidase subunit 3|nr:heme-copper oxidase subunit III [Thermoleophilaceae bacterium]
MESASLGIQGPARHGGPRHHEDHASHEDHHGPPEANRSSRVEPAFLGMLLFIISEIMLFGAFFTAYFFIRVVGGAEWPAPGTELPKLIAGVNTAILVSSSFTMHWAQTGVKNENRRALRAGLLATLLLGSTFLTIQINEYVFLGFAPSDHAQGSIFYGLTGLHGAHVFVGLTLLAFATTRAFRGHFTATEHRGVEVPGIYWHFVDVMWLIVYTAVYLV